MNPRESKENYLETALILKSRLGRVRSADIVNELGFSRASVSVAMKKLRETGHIEMDKDGYVTLTSSGQRIAEKMYERHQILSSFFISLGVDKKTALDDACKIEHVISQKTFDKIRKKMSSEYLMV